MFLGPDVQRNPIQTPCESAPWWGSLLCPGAFLKHREVRVLEMFKIASITAMIQTADEAPGGLAGFRSDD